MRIITGTRRGRIITAPKNLPVRPTTDRSKEALFSRLESHFHVSDLEALDLFSGTGNIAYELASRGAVRIDAVDEHKGCAQFIAQTAQELNFSALSVHRMDVFQFLNQSRRSYDFIFADPPYDFPEYEQLIDAVLQGELLKPDGWFVLEHRSDIDFSGARGFFDERKYGSVKFSTFVHEEEV